MNDMLYKKDRGSRAFGTFLETVFTVRTLL
jgi:hypothetical protein